MVTLCKTMNSVHLSLRKYLSKRGFTFFETPDILYGVLSKVKYLELLLFINDWDIRFRPSLHVASPATIIASQDNLNLL